MPLEAIFPKDYAVIYEDIEFLGVKMSVEKISADEYRIVRILSTNPEDYLKNEIQPGQVISRKLLS